MAEHMKTGNYSFKGVIIMLHFGEEMLVSLYRFLGTVVDALG